jgi:prevent-host-death family protein
MSDLSASLGVSEFKAHALQILDQVSRTGESVVITKRGKPIARVIPFVDEGALGTMGALADSVSSLGDLVSPLGEDDWDVCR